MTDPFAELVMPIFQRVIELQNALSWREAPTLDAIKKKTRGWIEEAELRARLDPRLSAEFAMTKYGLVAWIDEVLTDGHVGERHAPGALA